MAHHYGLLCSTNGVFSGIVACCFRLVGFPRGLKQSSVCMHIHMCVDIYVTYDFWVAVLAVHMLSLHDKVLAMRLFWLCRGAHVQTRACRCRIVSDWGPRGGC